MNKINKKILILLVTVLSLFIGINSIYGIFYTDGNSIGNYDSCSGGKYNGCLDYVGFEFTVVQITQHDQNGFKYKSVPNTQSFRLYRNFGLGSKLWYSSPNTFKTLDIIAEGGDVFDAIMTGTKAKSVLGNNFYVKSNNYAILVEELFGIIYWKNTHSVYTYDQKDCVYYDGVKEYGCNATIDFNKLGKNSFNGYYIADRMLQLMNLPGMPPPASNPSYEKYSGWRSVVAALSCNLYIKSNPSAASLCANPNYWTYDKEPERRMQIANWLMATKLQGILKNYNAGIVYGYNINPKKPGTLKLQKVKSGGTLITGKSATFKLYKNYNCSGNAISSINIGTSGWTTVTLDAGNYSIRENTAPSGYIKSNECRNFTITAGNTNIQSITNTQTCASEFNALSNKSNPIDRISLYKKYGYRNLLNFTITNASTACNTNSGGYSPRTSSGCLSYSKNYTPFNYNNVAYYSFTSGDATGRTAYCIDNFNLTNELGTSNFGTVKSGQMVINKNSSNRTAAIAVIDRICYVYGDNYGSSFSEASQRRILIKESADNYDVYFDNVKLNHTSTSSNGIISTGYKVGTYAGATYTEYTSRMVYKYNLNPVYSESGTGESTNSSKDNFIGYGLISKFSDKGTIGIDFELRYNNRTVTKYPPQSRYCSYKAEPEVVIPPGSPGNPGTPWKLNLAFRQISKSNPFPGKDGTGRTVGKNWCNGNNCNNDNKTVEQAITNKNDSYNSTGDGPKYIINLNTKTIEQIKNKNKGQAYDDFGENCNTSSGTCAIDFINWMKTQGILKEG